MGREGRSVGQRWDAERETVKRREEDPALSATLPWSRRMLLEAGKRPAMPDLDASEPEGALRCESMRQRFVAGRRVALRARPELTNERARERNQAAEQQQGESETGQRQCLETGVLGWVWVRMGRGVTRLIERPLRGRVGAGERAQRE